MTAFDLLSNNLGDAEGANIFIESGGKSSAMAYELKMRSERLLEGRREPVGEEPVSQAIGASIPVPTDAGDDASETPTMKDSEVEKAIPSEAADNRTKKEHSENTEDLLREDSENQILLHSMYRVGVAHLKRHENDEAMECFADALRMLRSKDDCQSNYEMIEKVLESMASVHGKKKEVDGVIDCYEEKLSVMRNRLGHEHVQNAQIATTLHTLGKDLVRLGDFERAMVYFEKSLKMKKEVFGLDHNEVALTLNNMGASLCKLKMYDDAVEVCTEALRISRVEPPDNTQETLALTILGSICKNRSRYDESVKYYEEALYVQRVTTGGDTRSTGVTLRNLGDVYFLAENVDKALSSYTEALSIIERANGKDPDLLRILGKLHKEKGTSSESVAEQKESFRQAGYYFKEAYILYSLQNKDEGKHQSSMFLTLSSLGEVNALLGLHYKSLSFYKSALKVLKSSKGGFKNNQVAALSTITQMGSLYMKLDDPDGALICFQEAIKERRDNDVIEEEFCLHSLLKKRGLAYMMKQNYDDALKDFEEALSLVPKKNHEDRLDIQHSIAIVYHRNGNLEGAIECYEEILQKRRQLVGEAHPLGGKTSNERRLHKKWHRITKQRRSPFINETVQTRKPCTHGRKDAKQRRRRRGTAFKSDSSFLFGRPSLNAIFFT